MSGRARLPKRRLYRFLALSAAMSKSMVFVLVSFSCVAVARGGHVLIDY